MSNGMIRSIVPMLIISALLNFGSGVLNMLMENHAKAGVHIMLSIAIVLLWWPAAAIARNLLEGDK